MVLNYRTVGLFVNKFLLAHLYLLLSIIANYVLQSKI